MIKNIVLYLLFPCLILALVLTFAGINKVEFGSSYYQFLNYVNSKFHNWEFSIPDIPDLKLVPKYANYNTVGSFWDALLNVARFIARALVDFVNIIITVVNTVSTVLNVIIQVVQFILTVVYCFKDFPQFVNIRYCFI